MLLRALSRLFDLDWTLTIAGPSDRDPVHAATLRALAEELQIARRVRFVGRRDRGAVGGTDLFALASYFEGYGVAIAEAMRRGLAVAVTNVGAVPVAGGTGSRRGVRARRCRAISKAMRRLIFDRPLLHDMAEVAWQSGQSLPSWNEQAARLAAVLAA